MQWGQEDHGRALAARRTQHRAEMGSAAQAAMPRLHAARSTVLAGAAAFLIPQLFYYLSPPFALELGKVDAVMDARCALLWYFGGKQGGVSV